MAKKRIRREKQDTAQAAARDRRLSSENMSRVLILSVLFGIITFVVLFVKLWDLQIVQGEDLTEQAVSQQTKEYSSSASRGTIYDANGAVLAISGSVQNVILSPRDVANAVQVDTTDEFGNARSEAVIEAETELELQNIQDTLAEGLAEILGCDPDDIRQRLEKTNSAYEVLAKKVEDDVADQVRQFIEDNGLSKCLYLTDDSKRYYPYSTLASQVIGFVNSSNSGAYGLEALYDSVLSGEDGKTLTAKNASGTEMLTPYASFVDAVDGYDVHTTIDATIQMYAEKALEEGIEKFDVTNGAFCIVMEPDTGAVLAMASYPNCDLNDPNTIEDAATAAQLQAMKNNPKVSEEEYEAAYSQAQFLQWSNKNLNTGYEPGSTFKPIVLSAALEEGVVDESNTFYCSGSVQMDGWTIRCSARSGHGTQTLRKAVMNSCNPAFISIGQKLGAEKFYEYWENFGFTSQTGIELPGEQSGVFFDKSSFISPSGLVNLAVASFGQRFTTTPIKLITALCAVVNGGHLMEPYLVQSVTDSDGNVISYHEPTEVRQVISEETSATVRSILESVVNDSGGTGKNAKVDGYHIGGKTGSSQTTDSEDHIIVSFLGFAPADDPQVVVLLAYDWPQPVTSGSNYTADGTYISGGNMAAPMAGELIANILDYLGYQKTDTSTSGVTVPNLTGSDLDQAASRLSTLGLNYKTSGEGTVVTSQAPSGGSSIPSGSTVVLYLGTERPDETVAMPDLTGMTYDEAKTALEDLGLYLNATGVEGGTVFVQTVDPGAMLEVGTVVEVKFVDSSDLDDEGANDVPFDE